MSARSSHQRAKSVFVHKAQAVLLASMFLAGNVGSLIHAVTERHARCPEHGHLIHVNDGVTDNDAEAPLAVQATVSVAVSVASGASAAIAASTSPNSAEHEHEHCHICPASRKWALHAAGPIVHVPQTAVVGWHAIDTETRPPGSTLYTLAPKTSPPV